MAERTVLCFGDSNTHGSIAMATLEDRKRFPPAQRWPNVTADALGPGWTVLNDGLPGRTSVFDDPTDGDHKNGCRVLPASLETHRPLDLVIIMLGTNDTKSVYSATAQDIAKGLERLVRMVQVSDAGPSKSAPKVLLVSPAPVDEVGRLAPIFVGGAEKSRALAPLLKDAAARLGTGFLDLAPLAAVDPVDGVHFTAEAQAAVGKAMADAIRSMFP